ncbi:hemerythrin domain-containing protein [Methanoculleus bourgensis]|jgi:hemerythrin superfamily protein|uniref:Hemerythrin HHE cation binding domain-containing protein n=2 Tax=Methanomicrobiaceae TaxID=2194 RepID=A0A0X3BIN9_9EURY|nr:hemerythrin domain-containing protein [Methanoculleus bourgensis]CVK31938.1 Hemerythrin HHE cation binding domain-containing protein [Methanoculleus bourgensis]
MEAGCMAQILELIRADHDFIRSLLDELADNPETRDVRCITLRRELPGHMYAEEATLYARLRGVAPEEIRQSISEHSDIRDMLARFEAIPLRDEAWMPALAGLTDIVKAHFAAEEEVIFSRAEHYLSRSELFELSEGFGMEKQKAAQFAVM